MIKGFLKEQVNKGVQQAISMGLTHSGFGMYTDPKSGKVTHMVKNGELQPIAKSQEKKDFAGQVVQQNPDNSFDKEGKMQQHAKQAFGLQQKVHKEIDDHFEEQDEEAEKCFNRLMKAQEKVLGGTVFEYMEENRTTKIALGEYLGSGAKVLNAYASKQLVKKFDTNNGKNPVRSIGANTDEKRDFIEQNYSNLIRTIDKLIEKCELQEKVVVYRGISVDNAEAILTSQKEGGGVINFPSFTSVTLDKNVAMQHSEGNELIITLPVGTKALLVEPTIEEHDMELILKRNSKIRIEKVEEHGDDSCVFTATLIAQ